MSRFRSGVLLVHLGVERVEFEGHTVPLRPTEYYVLVPLALCAGCLVTRRVLLQIVSEAGLRCRLSRIRKALWYKSRGTLSITTVVNEGYVLRGPVAVVFPKKDAATYMPRLAERPLPLVA